MMMKLGVVVQHIKRRHILGIRSGRIFDYGFLGDVEGNQPVTVT